MKKIIVLAFIMLGFYSLNACAGNGNIEILKRSDVGYQGPSWEEIQKLPLVSTLKPSGDGITDITNLQSAVDKASRKGGRIIITKGNYQFSEIVLKSNVHLLFKEGVIVTPLLNGKGRQDMFVIGKETGENIENVTFMGEGDKTTRPLFTYNQANGNQVRLFNNGRVVNLYIQNISIADEQTKFSAITFHPQSQGTTRDNIAKNISIINVSITNASYGYGLVQGNVGENMWLKDLVSEGGVCARIETHTGREENLGVYNVVIENVKCFNGKAAVTMQPHVVQNGVVTVDGAYAENCEWAVMIKDGFVSKKLDKSKKWEKGSFAKGTSIKNVHLVHGDSTVVAFQHKVYIPNSLYNLYDDNTLADKADKSGRRGPSIAALGNFASEPLIIDTATITHSGSRADERLLIVSEEVKR